MKKIGLMGGTFNPIHEGHLRLAREAYKQAGLDEVWFLPAKCPPHKEISGVVSNRDRYRMIERAIKNQEGFRVSDLEFLRKGTSYTYETLLFLNSLIEKNEYYFIMGADSLMQLDTWRKPEIILENAGILAACRDDVDMGELEEKVKFLEEKFKICRIRLVSYPKVDASSSEIREFIARESHGRASMNGTTAEWPNSEGNGTDVERSNLENNGKEKLTASAWSKARRSDIMKMLPEGVYEYIKEKRLYERL